MEEILKRLQNDAGISAEQAAKVIETLKAYIGEKFPMMAGAVDSLLKSSPKGEDPLDM